MSAPTPEAVARTLAETITGSAEAHPGVVAMIAAALRAARAAAIEEAARWQPIETAPRDGTPLLLGWVSQATGKWVVTATHWTPHGWAGSPKDFSPKWPTHWMQLPEPPTAAIRALGEESAAPREEESAAR